jgi:hypothetical protein
LDRKPWAYGEQVFHLLYRYSCQHSHFLKVQQRSRATFTPAGTLPYRTLTRSSSFGAVLSPVIFTAQENLTSELLRFL